MKTSNKILLISLAFITAVLLISTIAIRGMIGGNIETVNAENLIYLSKNDIKDFNGIQAEDVWEIKIIQGNEYSIDLKIPEGLEEYIILSKRGGTLVLGTKWEASRYGGFIKAVITMPELESIEASGISDISFCGFDIEELEIENSGKGQVTGLNSQVDYLKAELSGVGSLDLKDVLVTNAYVDMSGLGSIEITMNGGKLKGELSGMGSIEYYGNIIEFDVDISGMGSVEHK